ncbi:hypothetical protein [Bacillus toyonensis]
MLFLLSIFLIMTGCNSSNDEIVKKYYISK